MKKLEKCFATVFATALLFTTMACQTGVEEKIVEKIVEVPVDMTSQDATVVYHWMQDASGVGYEKSNWQPQTKNVKAGTKLEALALTNLTGYKPKGLVESLQADGTYAINVYYDRNLVEVTLKVNGQDIKTKGLYDSYIDFAKVNAVLESEFIITTKDNPPVYKYPAEDAEYTITTKTATTDTNGFVKVVTGPFKDQYYGSVCTISLTKELYVCDHEVTQGEWEEYMTYYGKVNSGSFACPKNYNGKGEQYPVYYVNWYEAVIYCNLLSKANSLDPVYYLETEANTDPADWLESETLHTNIKRTSGENGKYYYYYDGEISNTVLDNETTGIKMNTSANGYRLPTRAEWKYLALGSYKDSANWDGEFDSINYHWPFAGEFVEDDYSNMYNRDAYVWDEDNSNYTTHEVKGKLPNSYGLYDMTGNVYEWCYDWGKYTSSYSEQTDPTGPESGTSRICCGGSKKSVCEVSLYYPYDPSKRNDDLGFRIVRNAN